MHGKGPDKTVVRWRGAPQETSDIYDWILALFLTIAIDCYNGGAITSGHGSKKSVKPPRERGSGSHAGGGSLARLSFST